MTQNTDNQSVKNLLSNVKVACDTLNLSCTIPCCGVLLPSNVYFPPHSILGAKPVG